MWWLSWSRHKSRPAIPPRTHASNISDPPTDILPPPQLAEPASGLCSSDPLADTTQMMSGRCRYSTQMGTLSVGCPCLAGVFAIPSTMVGPSVPICLVCGHPSFKHESIPTAIPPPRHEIATVPGGVSPIQPPYSADRYDSPRTQTIIGLWEQLQDVRVVHIRGTPTSGKSKLAMLLESFLVRNYHSMRVFSFSWPGNMSYPSGTNFNTVIKQIIGHPEVQDSLLNCSDMVFIIDECQNSYAYESLWTDFIKIQASGSNAGPFLALFSSYGSPGEIPIEHEGSAPVHLTAKQRVSLRPLKENNPHIGLYFTKEEFMDVVGKVCSIDQFGQKFMPSEELIEYIWTMTSGHPGGTRAILDVLLHSEIVRPFRKLNLEVPLEEARKLLDDDKTLFEHLMNSTAGFKRSLPKREKIQDPSTTSLLRKVIANNFVEGDIKTDHTLERAYKSGWLQAELSDSSNTVYVFPTLLHRRYYTHLLIESDFPSTLFPNLRGLVIEAIKNFSAVSLRTAGQTLGPGATVRPVEAQFQDELYRSCYKVLDNRVFLTPEWSGSRAGRIDFQIKPKKWGIEAVRGGSDLQGHIDRFLPQGKYHPWILAGELLEYIIVDFRWTRPSTSRDVPFLIYAVFSENFSTCQLLDSNLQAVCPGFAIFA